MTSRDHRAGPAPTAYLRGPAYVLGEHERDHSAIAELPSLAERFKMAPNPGLWGWGKVRMTERELEDLAIESGTATLRSAGVQGHEVDALVVCSNRIPGPAEGHGEFVQKVLRGIGLGEIAFYGANLNRCVNLLAGLDLARALVLAGRHREVLLVTTDKVAVGADRMSQFALFSDGAASCLVSAAAGQGECHEILGCASATQTATLEWTREISSDLARQVSEALLAPLGLKLGEVAVLAHANLFKPLLVMKERQAGFTAGQLYLDNITRFGHCFAADPIINLADRVAAGHLGVGEHCMLASSVPGCRIGVLARRVC